MLQALASRLQEQFPEAVVTLHLVTPNYSVLDVVLGEQLFELEWEAGQGFGVTHVTEDKSFTRGSDAGFDEASIAENYLLQQLAAIADIHREE